MSKVIKWCNPDNNNLEEFLNNGYIIQRDWKRWKCRWRNYIKPDNRLIRARVMYRFKDECGNVLACARPGEGHYPYLYNFHCGVLDERSIVRGHRLDGPAKIDFDFDGNIMSHEWRINGADVSNEVDEWIDNMDIPPFFLWGDAEKMAFKLRFGGVI